MKKEKVVMIGFGTLLLQESLGDTIKGSGTKKFTPVLINNYKRLFNLLPDHYEAYNFLRTDGTERGAANIEPAKGIQFNGLGFEVDVKDLSRLDKRERYYNRSVVPYCDFYTGEEMGIGHVYESPLDARWLFRDAKDLLPLWRDIVYARIGAYRISEAFGKMYDKTTYLADGKTLMIDYYEDYINKLKDLEAVRLQYEQ